MCRGLDFLVPEAPTAPLSFLQTREISVFLAAPNIELNLFFGCVYKAANAHSMLSVAYGFLPYFQS